MMTIEILIRKAQDKEGSRDEEEVNCDDTYKTKMTKCWMEESSNRATMLMVT